MKIMSKTIGVFSKDIYIYTEYMKQLIICEYTIKPKNILCKIK